VVYGSSLENWRGCKLTVSSNLTPSATLDRRTSRVRLNSMLLISANAYPQLVMIAGDLREVYDLVETDGKTLCNIALSAEFARLVNVRLII
jgi:hypothetical protein